MSSELLLRAGTTADVPEILDLMRASLGELPAPRARAFWDWKHQHNPFGRSPYLVAVAGDRIVGVRVFMRWTWRAAGRAISAVRAVDTATHPSFQGRGIFSKLTLRLVRQLTDEGVGFVYNTPNEKSRPGYLKMGWSTVGRISLWVRPTLHLPLAPLRRGRATEAPPGERRLDLLDAPDARALVADLAEREMPRYHTRRDPSYLRWRYVDPPGFDYGFTSADPRRALVVYRPRRRRGLRELTLCEVLHEPSVRGVRSLRETLRALVAGFRPDYLVCSASGIPAETMARVAGGFVLAPRAGPVFTARPLALPPSAPDPLRWSNWHVSIGDLELF